MQNLPMCIPWVEAPTNPKWIRIIKEKGETLHFPKNTIILNNGDLVRSAYYVDKGVVKYLLNAYCGSVRVVGILPPGRTFGLGPIFHQKPIILTVTTIDNSTVYSLPQEEILQAIQANIDLAVDIINNVSYKLRSVMTALCLVSTCDAKERLAHYFFTLIFYDYTSKAKVSTWAELPINLSHEQIGEIIGTNRVTVCRLFNLFKRQNKLKQINNRVYVNTHWLRSNVHKLYNTSK